MLSVTQKNPAYAVPRNPNGRPPGIPNKRTLEVERLLKRLGCNPIEGMARIAMNDVPCGVCRGTGRTKYSLGDDHSPTCSVKIGGPSVVCTCEHIGERTCQSCYGSLYESISPETRGKMYSELAKYRYPQLKAVEHTGNGAADGGRAQITVVFADGSKRGAPQQQPAAIDTTATSDDMEDQVDADTSAETQKSAEDL